MARYLSEHGLETLWGDIEQYVGSQTEGTAESDGTDAGPIVELTAHGWATQDGTPSPDSPVEIQVARGHEVTGKTGRFVDLVVKQGDTTLSTTSIPLPSRGWVGALPDGTADVLTLDGAGGYVWEMGTDEVVLDGSSDESWTLRADVGDDATDFLSNKINGVNTNATIIGMPKVGGYAARASHFARLRNGLLNHLTVGEFFIGSTSLSSSYSYMIVRMSRMTLADFTTWLAQNPVTILYPLATPVTDDMGYVDLPEIPEGATLSCPELDALGVHYLTDDAAVTLARQWYERAYNELGGAVVELAARVNALESADGTTEVEG